MHQSDPTTASRGEEAAESEDTRSAGEVGTADAVVVAGPSGAEVIVGEIPSAEDPTTMLWTARCSEADHDLIGYFETREAAETARAEHLESIHGGGAT